MVVLLKIASVRVSFIQTMQIRVQNKRKSVRKVDTTKTYQTSSRGCRNIITRKKNKTGNDDFGIVSIVMTPEDTDGSQFFLKYCKAKGTSHDNQMFT